MRKRQRAIGDPAVAAVFAACPEPVRSRLLALRRLILDTAQRTDGVGAIEETLKWGQPSYLTSASKSGSTVRIDGVKSVPNQYAIYFHCQTSLVETFRELYPELSYGGNRSILLDAGDELPEAALRHCVALALTYHLNKARGGVSTKPERRHSRLTPPSRPQDRPRRRRRTAPPGA
ncbi:DUF1801 domain-containing protein [Bradyrhizobium sp. NP1]|uniref:DUF1801 domain-containing protein n=1 Tax=Bradyrhizobium sp. NP1 TaxID=3049772 RepID=UPI0025A5998F|nr:DUF1801 domain-containing protein [Bradyrhizobium sp. NP1]WJR77977.1 DUF1801 domain-containing protein [Bradyrhizobium sp. NP1]